MKQDNKLIDRKRNTKLIALLLILFVTAGWKDIKKGFRDGFEAGSGNAPSLQWTMPGNILLEAGNAEFMLIFNF